MTETTEPGVLRRLAGSARSRVLLAFVVLLAFASVVSVGLLRQVLQARTGDRVNDSLEQEVEEFRRLARGGRDPDTGRRFGANVKAILDVYLAGTVPGDGEVIATFLDGKPYRSTSQIPVPQRSLDELLALGDVRRPTLRLIGGRRVLAVPVAVGGRSRGTFLVAIDLAGEEAEVDDAIRTAATVSAIALLLATALGFVLAGRVLRPLRDVTGTARSITESDLTRRIPVHGNDEIAQLSRTFNAMLDRLETAFDSQRALVSDAGHELRTPVTIIRGHLELLGDDPEERRETLALVDDELDRMGRLVEDLLTLANAERPDFLRPEQLDLDDVTTELHSKASRLAPRDWVLEPAGTGRIRADRQRITQAVMNLASNAVHATSEGDRIGLGSSLDRDGTARIWVSDSGPGVSPEIADSLFERFARGAERSADGGSGLGLAISQAIAEAHGGRLNVDGGDRPGTGATFIITIPGEPPPEVET